MLRKAWVGPSGFSVCRLARSDLGARQSQGRGPPIVELGRDLPWSSALSLRTTQLQSNSLTMSQPGGTLEPVVFIRETQAQKD